jgi:hypothetical protein
VGRDSLDKVANAVKKTVDDVKDSIHEAGHRSAAEEERAKREVFGGEMTPGEKVGSGLNEAKERVQAEVDEGKRKLRDSV